MEQKGQNWGIKGKICSSINKKLINYAIWSSYGTVSVLQPRNCWQNSQCQGAKYNRPVKILQDDIIFHNSALWSKQQQNVMF